MAEKKRNKVRPQVLKGFRDYSPSEQIARERILAKLRQAVELMGFLPFQTASLEHAETLLGPHYTEDSLAELFGFATTLRSLTQGRGTHSIEPLEYRAAPPKVLDFA